MVEFKTVSVDISVIRDGPDDRSVRSFVADDWVISLVVVVLALVVGILVGVGVFVIVAVVLGVVVGVVVVGVGVVVGIVAVVVGVADVLVFIGPGEPSGNSVVSNDLMDVPLISLVDIAVVMVLRCVCIVVIIIVTVSIKVDDSSMVVVRVE